MRSISAGESICSRSAASSPKHISTAWSSLSGGHDRFQAVMSFEPEKDTPARKPALPAESLLHADACESRTLSTFYAFELTILRIDRILFPSMVDGSNTNGN